jgi:hypothetical protein
VLADITRTVQVGPLQAVIDAPACHQVGPDQPVTPELHALPVGPTQAVTLGPDQAVRATNAAWLALAVIAHNLGRAVGHLAGHRLERATAATLRRTVFTVPGRLVHTGRRRHLRLPANWPWADPVLLALTRITAIPLRC